MINLYYDDPEGLAPATEVTFDPYFLADVFGRVQAVRMTDEGPRISRLMPWQRRRDAADWLRGSLHNTGSRRWRDAIRQREDDREFFWERADEFGTFLVDTAQADEPEPFHTSDDELDEAAVIRIFGDSVVYRGTQATSGEVRDELYSEPFYGPQDYLSEDDPWDDLSLEEWGSYAVAD